MTATKEAVVKNQEQELRSEITKLDRKIEAQRVHIEKLTAELADKQAERVELVKQRIRLLQQELPTEPKEQ